MHLICWNVCAPVSSFGRCCNFQFLLRTDASINSKMSWVLWFCENWLKSKYAVIWKESNVVLRFWCSWANDPKALHILFNLAFYIQLADLTTNWNVEDDISKDEALIVLFLSADACTSAIAFNTACADHWRSQQEAKRTECCCSCHHLEGAACFVWWSNGLFLIRVQTQHAILELYIESSGVEIWTQADVKLLLMQAYWIECDAWNSQQLSSNENEPNNKPIQNS